jgi:hypothetical protein
VFESVVNVEQAVVVVCMLIEMTVKKVSVIYTVVLTVEYKLIFSFVVPIAPVAYE